MDKHRFGQLGEVFASRYLWKHGYRVLMQNYKCRHGEIDLVAAKRKKVIFVEVKTRTPNANAQPKEAVDFQKQKRIVAASLNVLKFEELAEFQPRFDVIEVTMEYDSRYNKAKINHIKNAFGAEMSNVFI